MSLPVVADGYGLDRALAAMFCGAKAGETVSLMAARADQNGRRWGCWLCWFLSIAVERGHCALALATSDAPTAKPAAYRAGALLFALLVAIWAVPLVVWWVVERAI
jgi:hypothetical protein